MKTFYAAEVQLSINAPFELNGLAYPANWLTMASPEDLSAHGISMVEVADPPAGEYIPSKITVVTPRQARLALLSTGLLDSVQQMVDASPDKTLKITWEYATEFTRNDSFILALAGQFGLTSDQVDNLFDSASKL